MKKIHITESQLNLIKKRLNESDENSNAVTIAMEPTDNEQTLRKKMADVQSKQPGKEVNIEASPADFGLKSSNPNGAQETEYEYDPSSQTGQGTITDMKAQMNKLVTSDPSAKLIINGSDLKEGITKKQIKKARLRMLKENSFFTTKRILSRKKY